MSDKNSFGGTKARVSHLLEIISCIHALYRGQTVQHRVPRAQPKSGTTTKQHKRKQCASPLCTVATDEPAVLQAVAGVQRRTWDKEAAAQRQKEKDASLEDGGAQEKARKIREKPVERNPLSAEVSRAGAGNVDYMGQVGKVKMATAKDASKDRVGAFYCPVTTPAPCHPASHSPTQRNHANCIKHARLTLPAFSHAAGDGENVQR